MSGSLGTTAGLALGGSVAYLAYSLTLRDTLPEGLDPEVAVQSTDTVGGALAGAEAVGGATGQQLLGAVIDAFARATTAAYLIAVLGIGRLARHHLLEPAARWVDSAVPAGAEQHTDAAGPYPEPGRQDSP